MKTIRAYLLWGFAVCCWIGLVLVNSGCVSPGSHPAELVDAVAKVEAAKAKVDLARVEAAAKGDLARVAELDSTSANLATRSDRLAALEKQQTDRTSAPAAVAVSVADAVAPFWPPAAIISTSLAGLAEILRRKHAKAAQEARQEAIEISKESEGILSDVEAAKLIVTALEHPDAAPARKLVSQAAKAKGLTLNVERLLANSGIRQPSHV